MRLEITKSNGQTEIFESIERTVIVGRSSKAHCLLKEDGISREHIKIELKGGKVFITDMNSSNGSFVQDTKLTPNMPTEWQIIYPVKIGKDISIIMLPEMETINAGEIIKDKKKKKSSKNLISATKNKANNKSQLNPVRIILIILVIFLIYSILTEQSATVAP